MVAHSSALALLPEELSAIEAGPLVCAGVTTFNSLRSSGARPGETVAVLGLGGLRFEAVNGACEQSYLWESLSNG
jgi:propanol-preferring alcohol dehydrogenase